MQVGNYLIEKEIGEGGMSNVYLAKHHRLQKNVAIKVLKSEYIKNENIQKIRNCFLDNWNFGFWKISF
jgi:serine/threonine-protein kinase